MDFPELTLLDGPRGRRTVLEYVLACAQRTAPSGSALWSDVFHASQHLEPSPNSRIYLTWDDTDSKVESAPEPDPIGPPEQVADAVRATPLHDPDPELLLEALSASVNSAFYWQPPGGTDVLAGTAPVREAMQDAARLLAGSELTRWWSEPVDLDDQWYVQRESPADPVPQPPAPTHGEITDRLTRWRIRQKTTEERERREAPDAPATNVGGEWWTTPPWPVFPSTRTFPGTDMPVGVPLEEDKFGDTAYALRCTAPDGARIFEVTGPDDWARLCLDFPLDQTYSLRNDWFNVTGRDGRWIVPDWSAVAEVWDAVHVSVAGYLRTATRSIDLGCPPDGSLSPAPAATMMAGWSPDETRWFRAPQVQPTSRSWADNESVS